MVTATVEIYQRIADDLLPTPEKSHYVFNLRDLSKCIQGIMQADPVSVKESKQILRYQDFKYLQSRDLLDKSI